MHVAKVLPLSDPVPNQGTEPTPYSVHRAPASGRGSCPALDAILLSKGPRQGGERIAEDRSTTGSERRDTGNFLTNIDVWELGVMLLVAGVVAFLCGLFEVFGYYHRRENDLLTYAGGILFLVGIVLVAVSLYRKGKV